MGNEEGQQTLAEEVKPEDMGQFKQQERPTFEKPVKAKVSEVHLFVNPKVEVSTDGDKKQRAYLQVKYALVVPHKFASGQETSEAVSNYGLSIFINGEGAGLQKNLYWGKNTDANKLKTMLCDQAAMPKTADMLTVINTLRGKTVMLKTEMRQNPEDKSLNPKVLVSQILPE